MRTIISDKSGLSSSSPLPRLGRLVGLFATFALLFFAGPAAGDEPNIEVSQGGQVLVQPDGAVFGWGGWDTFGVTRPPLTLTGVKAVALGDWHSAALRRDGTVVCWGNTAITVLTTVPPGLTGVKAIDCGQYFTLALRENGTVIGWGYSSSGQLTPPAGLNDAVAISAGAGFGLALRSNGTVVAWGDNSQEQCNVPAGLTGVRSISAGGAHVLALKTDGTVVAWGSNLAGQAIVPAGLSGIVAVAAGSSRSAALRSDGTVAAWGNSTTDPPGISSVESITSGDLFGAGLLPDGSIQVWGYNPPVPPAGLPPVQSIAGGANHLLAVSGTPPKVEMGTLPVGVTGAAKDFTVRNTGSGVLHVTAVAPGGLSPADFAVSAPALPVALAAGEQFTFSVRFQPRARSARHGAVILQCDDPRDREFRINLTGTGLESNAGLASLAVSHGTLTPAFSSAVGSYNLTLPRGQATMTFTPVLAAPPAVIRYRLNGGSFATLASGTASASQALAFGDNLLEIEITAEDGISVRTYALTVTRPLIPDILLETADGTPLPAALTSSVVAWGLTYDVPAGLTDVVAISCGQNGTAVLRSNGTVVPWGGFTEYFPKVPFPAGLSNVKALASGFGHTLALKDDGTVAGWGDNDAGQVTVPAGLSGVTAIAAGYKHSLALKADGTLIHWGRNVLDEDDIPAGLNNVTAISARSYRNFALRQDGTVVTWGYSPEPPPANVTGVKAISAGFSHCMALRHDGTVRVWGNDTWDYGWPDYSVAPPGIAGAAAVAAGNGHSLVLRNDGTVFAWGVDEWGACTPPAGLQDVVAISAGGWFSTALVRALPRLEFSAVPTGGSAVKTVRIRNSGTAPLHISSITLTDGDLAEFSIDAGITLMEVPASGETTFTVSFHPAAGGMRAAILRVASDDHLKGSYDLKLTGAGISTNAALGSLTLSEGVLKPAFSPAVFASAAEVRDITGSILVTAEAEFPLSTLAWRVNGGPWQSEGTEHAFFPAPLQPGPNTVELRVTAQDGVTVQTYSLTVDRRLGPEISVERSGGTVLRSSTPGNIISWGYDIDFMDPPPGPPALTGVRSLAAGNLHTVALLNDGTLRLWGDNSVGQLDMPAGLSSVTGIAAGAGHTLAVTAAGTVAAWGYNEYGQCNVPADLSGVVAVAAASSRSFALRSDGTVVAWGDHFSWSLTPPPDFSGVTALAPGDSHVVALRSDGTVAIWGDFSTERLMSPPPGLNGVTAVAAGYQFSLALKNDGTVTGWGGHGTAASVPPGLTGVTAIAGGFLHAAALKSDGTVATWGDNQYGQTNVPPFAGDIVAISAAAFGTVALRPEGSLTDFGACAAGLNTAVQTFTVRNSGNAPLTIFEVSVTGPDAADFTLSGGFTDSIAPGAGAAVTVTFLPHASGPRQAMLQLINNDTTEGTFTLPLTGTGTAPAPGQSAYLAWAAGASLSGFDALPAAGPRGDGVSNLLKYAFNLDATGPDVGTLTTGGIRGLPLFTITGAEPQQFLRVEFLRRRNSGLVYTPMHGGAPDSFVPFSASAAITTVDAEWERVLIAEPLDAADSRRQFGRVEVTLP